MRPETPFMMMPISRTCGAVAVDGEGLRIVVSDTDRPSNRSLTG
jgi:hypothetical protein